MKKLYVTELNLIPRIRKDISDTFTENEQFVKVEEQQARMTHSQFTINLLFVDLLKLLIEEIEASVLKLCEFADKSLFTIEYIITQSLVKGLMSVMGKDYEKLSFKT